MRMMSRGVTVRPANSRVSTKSMPFSFGLRAQPGSTSAGRCADAAEADQVAGIDRHAEMQDLAAGPHDAGRPDVAPVHHRRGADHQQQVGALARSGSPSARAIGFLVMRRSAAAAAASRSAA